MANTRTAPFSSKIESRLEIVESKIEQNVHLFTKAEHSQDRFLRYLTIISTLVFALAGGFGILNVLIQNNKIDNQISEAKEKIRDIISQSEPKKIETLYIQNNIGQTDLIYAYENLTIRRMDENVIIYDAILSFPFKLKFTGSGLNHIIGVYYRFDDKLVKSIYENQYGSTMDNLTSGQSFTYSSPITVAPGDLPYSLEINTTNSKKTCKEVQTLFDNLIEDDNLGSIEITPIFDSPVLRGGTRTFLVKAKPQSQVVNCNDLNKTVPATTMPQMPTTP